MKNIKKLLLAVLMLCGTAQVKPSFTSGEKMLGVLQWTRDIVASCVKRPNENKKLILALSTMLYSLYYTGKTHIVNPIEKIKQFLNDLAAAQGLMNPHFLSELEQKVTASTQTEVQVETVGLQTEDVAVADSSSQTEGEFIEAAKYIELQMKLYKRDWFEALQSLDVAKVKTIVTQNIDIAFLQDDDGKNAFALCDDMLTELSKNHIKGSEVYEAKIHKILNIKAVLAGSQKQAARL